MPISGNLRTMPLGDLLQWIAMARKSGTLVVRSTFKRRILFEKGEVALIASDNLRERLGYFLVGWGYLTERQLSELLAEQQKLGKMLGDMLIERGLLTFEELVWIFRVRAQNLLVSLLLLEEADFRFLDSTATTRASVEVRFPVDRLLFEAARRADEWRQMLHVVPGCLHIPLPVGTLDPSEFDVVEREMAAALDGSRSIEEVALAVRLPDFFVARLVFRAVSEGKMEVLPPRPTPAPLPGSGDEPWAHLLREAEICLSFGDLLGAFENLRRARRDFSEIREVDSRAQAILVRIESAAERDPAEQGSVVELAIDPAEIIKLRFSTEEAFVISRVDGRYTLQQTLAMFPGERLHGRLIVENLLQQGILKLRECKDVARKPNAPGSTTGDQRIL